MEWTRKLGITCISVAHRPTLLRWHENRLAFDGRGGCVPGPASVVM